MPRIEASIRIENVVATGTLNQRIDLNAVVKGNPTVEYRPKQFPGLVYRLMRPKTKNVQLAKNKPRKRTQGRTNRRTIHLQNSQKSPRTIQKRNHGTTPTNQGYNCNRS